MSSAARWPSAGAGAGVPPGDATERSRMQVAGAGVASRAPASVAAPPICSLANSGRRRRTCRAGACRAAAAVAALDERDERRNYRGEPGRDPAADSERRRRASCAGSWPGG